jgi:choline dehydrogenase-like flavoprotein
MGGATLAKELSAKGKDVLVLEQGGDERKVGTFKDCLRYYNSNKFTKLPKRSKEGVILWRTIMAGGSTVVSCANGVRCLEKELSEFGVPLGEELMEVEREAQVSPIAEDLLSESSKKIMSASKDLGYRMERMPKFINPKKCRKCGNCVMGCTRGAKWTALNYLKEAARNGAQLAYHIEVQSIIVENGKAKGVRALGPQGQIEILSDIVIVSAGGLGTPVILQHSGIREAGTNLFVDLFVNTYGMTEELNPIHEPPMALVDHEFYRDRGFILSPFVNYTRVARWVELGVLPSLLPSDRFIGLMTKIVDEPVGCVFPDGRVSKPVTIKDQERLKEGTLIATEILVKAGVRKKSIFVSRPQGAHLGGTAAIGKVVDKDLQTKVENLFVCDLSVFPVAPGMPPMLTIAALAKRLAKTLT